MKVKIVWKKAKGTRPSRVVANVDGKTVFTECFDDKGTTMGVTVGSPDHRPCIADDDARGVVENLIDYVLTSRTDRFRGSVDSLNATI